MYKFYKILANGNKKHVGTYNTTLHPDYHGYINWCRENKMAWELRRTSDNRLWFSGDKEGKVTSHH